MKQKYIWFVFFLLIQVNAQAQTLNNYLQEAGENNPNLKAQYLAFEVALEKVSQVALADPQVSFGYFISPIETRLGAQRAKFGLSQMFPWFGTLKAQRETTALLADAKYQSFLEAKASLFFQVKNSYYPIYELKEKVRWQNENINILRTYKALAETVFSSGKGKMVDIVRADMLIAEAETEVQLLEEQLPSLEISFNQLLNREDTLSVVVEDTLAIKENIKAILSDTLFVNHPKIQQIDNQLKASLKKEEWIKKQNKPQFQVRLDYTIIEENELTLPENGRDAFIPTVGLSIPIHTKSNKAKVKEVQLQQQALTASKQSVENQFKSLYSQTIYELQKQQKLLQLYDSQIGKLQQAIRLLYTDYSNSGDDFEDILKMQQQLLNYQTKKVSAVTHFYKAQAKLDYLMNTYK